MNNAQMFWNYGGTDSSGTHMEAAKKLVAAAEKYFTLRGSKCTDDRVNAAWFAMMPASPALVYDVGEIVQIVRDGVPHYGVVTKYTRTEDGGYIGIDVKNDSDRMAHGLWTVDSATPGKYKLHLPKELVDAMRMQLTASCPLKEAACGR